MNHESRLLELCDRQEIMTLLTTYTRGLDRRDEGLIASVYHPDATHDHGMWKGNAYDFAAYSVESLASMHRTMHSLFQSTIEFESRTSAVGETYCLAGHRVKSRQGIGWADHYVWMRYIDRFERRDGGPWLISRRVVAWEWTRIDPVEREWNLSESFQRGSHDESDPIYTFLGLSRSSAAAARS
jgi:hypothetical protein